MKYNKMIVLVLALTVMSWAQTATQAPSAPQQSTVTTDKAKCSCCDKMATADAKDTNACCAHHDMNAKDSKEMASGKDTMSCCNSKDAKSCIRKDKDKTAASCCTELWQRQLQQRQDCGVVLRFQLRPGRERLLLVKENREDSEKLLQRRAPQLRLNSLRLETDPLGPGISAGASLLLLALLVRRGRVL